MAATKRSAGPAGPQPCFPPSFPFLIISPTGRPKDAFALLEDTPVPAPLQDKLLPWEALLRVARKRAQSEPVALLAATLGFIITRLLDDDGEALLAVTADHAFHVARHFEDEPTIEVIETPAIDLGTEFLGHVPLTARLLDDPPEAVRRWRFSRKVASLSWDGGSPAHTGCDSVLQTASSWWAYMEEELSGPYETLRDALEAAAFFHSGGCTYSVRCARDIQDHPAILDSLRALAAPPARGVWCNGRELILNPQGLLFERLPFQQPLPSVPGC